MHKHKLRTISYGIMAILLLGGGLYQYKNDSIRKEINDYGVIGEGILTAKPNNCRTRQKWASLLYENKSYDFIISYEACMDMELGETMIIKYCSKYPNRIYPVDRLKTINVMIKWDLAILLIGLLFGIICLVRTFKRR